MTYVASDVLLPPHQVIKDANAANEAGGTARGLALLTDFVETTRRAFGPEGSAAATGAGGCGSGGGPDAVAALPPQVELSVQQVLAVHDIIRRRAASQQVCVWGGGSMRTYACVLVEHG